MQTFVEVRFLKGENARFFGAREAAREAGYPDVVSYLRNTGLVNRWCEEIPQELIEVFLKTELCRRKITQTLSLNLGE